MQLRLFVLLSEWYVKNIDFIIWIGIGSLRIALTIEAGAIRSG